MADQPTLEQAPPRPDTMTSWRASLGEIDPPLATPGAPPATIAPTTPPEPKPTPKPEPTPEPAKVEDANEPPEEKFPRTSEDWKKFKTARKEKEAALQAERDTIKKERDELTEKMKTLSSVTDAAEYQALKKERDEMEKVLRTANIRDNPKFKSHFEGKSNAQIELAKRIVGNEKGEQMARLLKLEDSDWKTQQIRDFVMELDVLDQSRIGGVLNSLAQISQERESALAVADKDYESITAAQKQAEEKAQQQRQQQVTTLIENGLKAITDPTKGNPVFQKRENDVAWNAAVDKRLETVKTLLTGQVSQQQIFDTAVQAVAHHQILNDFKAVQAENEGLKEQIKKLTAAQPTIEGGNRGAGGGNGEQPTNIPIKAGSRPMEVTGGWVKGMRDAMNNG